MIFFRSKTDKTSKKSGVHGFAKVIAGILILILLTGCSTYLNTLRAEIEGVPFWTLQTPSSTLQSVFFVGIGTDETGNQTTARQHAIENMLTKISEYLKYTVSEEFRRELMNTFSISTIALEIADEYLVETAEGGVRLYLLAGSDRKIISKLVRDNLESSRNASQLIDQPVLRAETAYNRKEDLAALDHYIDAAVQAYISPLDDADDLYQDIMNRVIQIVSNLVMQETSSDASKGMITIQITRGEGIFATKISDVILRAEYPIKNSAGRVRISELFLTTNNSGSVTFSTNNPGFTGQGVVKIYLDIDRSIDELEAITGSADSRLIQLKNEAAKLFFEFPFLLVSSVAGKFVVLSLLEFEMNGTFISGHPGMERMAEIMEEEGILANILVLDALNTGFDDDNSDENLLIRIRDTFNGLVSVAVIGNAGISGTAEGSGGYIATVKGNVKAVYLTTGIEIDNSGELVANGFGATAEAAKKAALGRFGEIAASRIVSILL
jgi:hypothetical protein